MPESVKIGFDQVEVEIPEGWYRVTSGPCQAGDMFINPEQELYEAGNIDIDVPAEQFSCLIREKQKRL
jgi:hypothetical protein